jgi:hypothetical protein
MSSYYLFKVWVTTIIIAPVLLMLLTWLSTSELDTGATSFVVFSIVWGFMFSLPTLILCYFLYPILSKNIKSAIRFKLIIILISFFGMAITVYFLFGPDSYNLKQFYGGLTISILYGICILTFGLLYRVKPRT